MLGTMTDIHTIIYMQRRNIFFDLGSIWETSEVPSYSLLFFNFISLEGKFSYYGGTNNVVTILLKKCQALQSGS